MDPLLPALPEWEAPVAIPVVRQEPYASLVKEVFERDVVNLKSSALASLLLMLLILWRRAIRRPFRRR